MKRLAVDEPPERLVDERHMRFAEQMMHVLRGAEDDPVERQLKQVAARLNARGTPVLQRSPSAVDRDRVQCPRPFQRRRITTAVLQRTRKCCAVQRR